MRFGPFIAMLWIGGYIGAGEPSYRQEVAPILSRAGCNQGACHGNLNGKGGFKLSLRGESPETDLATLTRDALSRRIDIQYPDQSLLLLKGAGGVAHEGGPRFSRDSSEYRILRSWIAAGGRDDELIRPRLTKLHVSPGKKILFDPEDRVKIEVTAEFTDGRRVDVSHLAVFETTAVGIVDVAPDGRVQRRRFGELNILVRYLDQQLPVTLAFLPERAEFAWKEIESANLVDRHLFPQLKELRLTPSRLADDSTFIRRVFLDVIGVLPTESEARAFLGDDSRTKRERLIDALIERPEFADFWAQKWGDLLRNEEKSLDRKGVRIFQQWLRDVFARDRPLNELAREIISARGSSYQNPAANLYRSLRDPYSRAESIAQVFLGIRVQCARCHNHPFDRWTQDDYHQFAAAFGRIDYRIVDNNRRDKFDKHEFDGDQIVFLQREGGLKHPRTREMLVPKILGSSELGQDDPLRSLADWVSDPANPFFAKAQANRIWFHMLGRGLVDPIDDFRVSNPAENPPMLDALADHLARSKFSLKSLVRLIANSRAYQLSASPAETNAEDDRHYSKALVQPLEAEQLLDAVAHVTGSRPKFDGYPTGTRAGQIAALSQDRRSRKGAEAERFLKSFGKPDRLLTCECERSEDVGVSQAFQLLTGELLQTMLSDPKNCLGTWLDSGKSDEQIVESLYLTAFSRFPSTEETARLAAFVKKANGRRDAWEDVVWGVVNSKEFLLRK